MSGILPGGAGISMNDVEPRCRSCGSTSIRTVLDLGPQPVADDLVSGDRLDRPDAPLPLRLGVCTRCWLVQLADNPPDVPSDIHGGGASFSRQVIAELDEWADELVRRAVLRPGQTAMGIGPHSDHLLVRLKRHGIVRVNPGSGGASGVPVDLVVAHHALAHGTSIDAALRAMTAALAPRGAIALEFHHVLGLLTGQFDIVCHAHQSYISLVSLQHALTRHGLAIEDAWSVAAYGGSIRLIIRHAAAITGQSASAEMIQAAERAAQLDSLKGYGTLERSADAARRTFRDFLTSARAQGRRIAAYGAPTRGTTLLNYCGVTGDDIAFTVDRDPAKQRRYLPGCRIPVLAPDRIQQTRPDLIVILPWPLADEIVAQEAGVRAWGGRFVVALPSLRVVP